MARNLTEQYDSALLGILQNEGNIGGFLDAVLGFLYRRTDFYKLLTSPEDKMGFPPGTALKILVSAFKKYEDVANKEDETMKRERRKKIPESTQPPPAVKTVEVTSEPSRGTDQSNVTNPALKKSDQSQATSPASRGTDKSHVTDSAVASNGSVENRNVTHMETESPSSHTENTTSATKSESKDSQREEEENPELTRLQQQFQANPDSYNGAIRDNYAWSQSITDVDVHVMVPKYITKGRDVKVTIEKKHLTVSHKTEKGSWEEVINEDLTWEINKEESMWSLVPSQHVHINLEKRQERWWEGLLTSEPKISVRKIDASRPMTDLDDEAQAKIEEMMYNERQKRMGLPTSEEKKMHNILKDAWDAEGSPFKGQPFDPSKLTMNQGGVLTVNPDQSPMEEK